MIPVIVLQAWQPPSPNFLYGVLNSCSDLTILVLAIGSFVQTSYDTGILPDNNNLILILVGISTTSFLAYYSEKYKMTRFMQNVTFSEISPEPSLKYLYTAIICTEKIDQHIYRETFHSSLRELYSNTDLNRMFSEEMMAEIRYLLITTNGKLLENYFLLFLLRVVNFRTEISRGATEVLFDFGRNMLAFERPLSS
jgi:hypothetical protein